MGSGIVLAILFILIVGIITTPGYINTESLLERKQAREIVASMNGAIMQRQNYQFEYSEPLPVGNWQSALNSQGLAIPLLDNLTWSYNVNGAGAYFCLTVTDATRRGYYFNVFNEVQNIASFNDFINSACGAISDFGASPDFITTNVSLTIYAGR